MCSVKLICLRPRTPSVGLPRFPANAARADGDYFKRADMNTSDLVGKRFGLLTVISFGVFGRNKRGRLDFEVTCRCDCGRVVIRPKSRLIKSFNRSCGCLGRTVNGESRNPEYVAWYMMKRRCFDKNGKFYHHYGGRGITVCDRWLNSYDNFLADMGRRPTSSHSLNRIDNDGHYCPENCRWDLPIEQHNNTRTNRWYVFHGKRLTLSQWSKEIGMNITTIKSRIDYLGWSVEKAFTTPVDSNHQCHTINSGCFKKGHNRNSK